MSQSIQPNYWGPHGWKFIHYVALGYPENPDLQDKNNYKSFYQNLQMVLPCKKCQKHYQENLRKLPIDKFLESKEKLFQWTVDIHNKVNEDLGKKIYSYEEAYHALRSNTKTFWKVCMFLLVLLLIYWILK